MQFGNKSITSLCLPELGTTQLVVVVGVLLITAAVRNCIVVLNDCAPRDSWRLVLSLCGREGGVKCPFLSNQTASEVEVDDLLWLSLGSDNKHLSIEEKITFFRNRIVEILIILEEMKCVIQMKT